MAHLIIPVELLKNALQYIEEYSLLVWGSGDRPTDYCPQFSDDTRYIVLDRYNSGRIYYSERSEIRFSLYEFNEMDRFIKGYERR